MSVTIEYFAQLRAATGAPSATIELSAPCTAQQLVARLATEHGDDFRRMVLRPDGSLQPSVLLFLDGRQVRWEEPVALTDGNRLLLATPVAGG